MPIRGKKIQFRSSEAVIAVGMFGDFLQVGGQADRLKPFKLCERGTSQPTRAGKPIVKVNGLAPDADFRSQNQLFLALPIFGNGTQTPIFTTPLYGFSHA